MLAATIREARMYDRALSESEIAASAGASSPGIPDAVLTAIQTHRDQRSPEQTALLREFYLRNVHAATREALKQPEQDARTLKDRIGFLKSEQNAPCKWSAWKCRSPDLHSF